MLFEASVHSCGFLSNPEFAGEIANLVFQSPSPASSLSLSPLSPRILSAKDGQWFHQSLLLVFGQVGIPDKPGCNGTLTVYHHLDGYPSTQWPVSEGYFKALVRLDPGPNKIRFEYNATKVSSFNTIFTFNMLPLTASPPLQLAILVGKDTTEELNVVQENLRMAAYLAQAFTGEQMYRNRLGRRCFRLEEEWAPDTISPRTMRNLVKVHVIRSESTAEGRSFCHVL